MPDSLNGIFNPQGDKVINPSINGHDPDIHVELLKPADVAPAILPDDADVVIMPDNTDVVPPKVTKATKGNKGNNQGVV